MFRVCHMVELRVTTSLQLLMALYKDVIYVKWGKSMFVSLPRRMIVEFYNEQDRANIPPGTTTPVPVAEVARATPRR